MSGRSRSRLVDRLLPVGGKHDVEAAPLQPPGQEVPDLFVVFDEQDLAHASHSDPGGQSVGRRHVERSNGVVQGNSGRRMVALPHG